MRVSMGVEVSDGADFIHFDDRLMEARRPMTGRVSYDFIRHHPTDSFNYNPQSGTTSQCVHTVPPL